mmetsp:Transcript_14791/g.40923  ORF Transcript_14791/g.40923 Transcript_14791/m.40923 type:complete len:225 (+) Transcript_14791:1639-2313(+)
MRFTHVAVLISQLLRPCLLELFIHEHGMDVVVSREELSDVDGGITQREMHEHKHRGWMGRDDGLQVIPVNVLVLVGVLGGTVQVRAFHEDDLLLVEDLWVGLEHLGSGVAKEAKRGLLQCQLQIVQITMFFAVRATELAKFGPGKRLEFWFEHPLGLHERISHAVKAVVAFDDAGLVRLANLNHIARLAPNQTVWQAARLLRHLLLITAMGHGTYAPADVRRHV